MPARLDKSALNKPAQTKLADSRDKRLTKNQSINQTRLVQNQVDTRLLENQRIDHTRLAKKQSIDLEKQSIDRNRA